jgi:hypothetical protein
LATRVQGFRGRHKGREFPRFRRFRGHHAAFGYIYAIIKGWSDYQTDGIEPTAQWGIAFVGLCLLFLPRQLVPRLLREVEGTCNAQASDDRIWVEIQVLERRLQAVRPEGARFALYVLFAFAAFYSLFPYVLSPIRPAWSAMVRSPTSFAGSAFHSLLFLKSTYSFQLTSPSLSFYEDQLDQCRGEPAQLAENKTLAPVRIVRLNADHGGTTAAQAGFSS